MAVDDPLDFTPFSTMSTIQTKSEATNVIITSILAVLILANIGSAVSKAVYFTRHVQFDYNAWLRAFIFANSDDPLRIFSWLLRKYDYRDPSWVRAKNHLRPSRLIFPLLARTLILLASIASVALTIPGEKKLKACSKQDYTLTFNFSDARDTGIELSNCVDIPLHTELGSIRSSASYCFCPNYQPFSFKDPEEAAAYTGVLVSKNTKFGFFNAHVAHGDDLHSLLMYVEWKDLTTDGVTYRSNTDALDLDTQMNVAIAAVKTKNRGCNEITKRDYSSDEKGNESLVTILDNCVLGGRQNLTLEARFTMESYFRNALIWRPNATNDRRIKIDKVADRITDDFNCPFQVVVSRPIANIIPLTIALLLWCLVNVLVSFVVKKRGHNALDAGFHLIKEVLGHDCTSNPLEENVSRDEVTSLNLYKWVCDSSGGGGHVGYLGREGDRPVEEFGPNVVVGGCAKARTELENIRVLTGHPQRRRRDQPTTSNDAVPTARPDGSPMAPSTPTTGPHHSGVIAIPPGGVPYPTVPVHQGSMPLPHQSFGLPPPASQYPPPGQQYPPTPPSGGYPPYG